MAIRRLASCETAGERPWRRVLNQVRAGETTTGHWCGFDATDPDERRARGPHPLVEDRWSGLQELNRDSPHRSNPNHQRERSLGGGMMGEKVLLVGVR